MSAENPTKGGTTAEFEEVARKHQERIKDHFQQEGVWGEYATAMRDINDFVQKRMNQTKLPGDIHLPLTMDLVRAVQEVNLKYSELARPKE